MSDEGLYGPDKKDISHVEFCYDYELNATKDATATWYKTIDWTITKDADANYVGFAGDSFPHGYTVVVTKDETFGPYLVEGKITITNPSPLTVNFSVEDSVGGTLADVHCPSYSLAPGTTIVCPYDASLAGAFNGTNTATITSSTPGVAGTEAEAGYTFPVTPLLNEGSEPEVITVIDTNGLSWATGATVSWPYTQNFVCPTDQSLYVNGRFNPDPVVNTATIDQTKESDSAMVDLDCYLWSVGKTANGTYQHQYGWDIYKKVTPASQSGFPGDTMEWTWEITWNSFLVGEVNYAVNGVITVNNPAPIPLTVDVTDYLTGGVPAAVNCNGGTSLTIPEGGSATCSYSAAPNALLADNTATATRNGVSVSANVQVPWVKTGDLGLDAVITDTNGKTIPFDADQPYIYSESEVCSTDIEGAYGPDGSYPGGATNTATITWTGGADTYTAETAYNCYVPRITKTANGTFDEVHDWDVFKTGAAAQKKFAGQTASFNWTVRVDETTHGENYLVKGDITVVNPNPEDALVVTLKDVLDDGSVATIGPCVGGTLDGFVLTVPAGGTATCQYSVTPKGDLDIFALALPAQVTMKVDYPENGDPAYFEVVTITGGGPAIDGTYEGWCIDQDNTIAQNTNYTANVYSSYEDLPAGLVENPQNFDLVNWIINQDFVYKSAAPLPGTYTYGDVQRAIWELIDNSPFITSGLGTWNQLRVNQIKALAVANGEGFVPTCGDFVAVILQPVGGAQAITIAQVTFASLGLDCAKENVVTAVFGEFEFPASAEILWTSNPINPTATLDDTQNPAWPITVSGDQTFTYKDPQGYVCPTDPTAYAGDGIAPVYTDSNTATITYEGGSKSSSASTSVTCYGPVVSKTAVASYDETHTWTIEKSVNPTSQGGFPGDVLPWTWTVNVSETSADSNFAVSGEIKVTNPAGSPGNMVINLTDVLDDGTVPTITGCTGGTWDATKKTVTVAVNTTAVCNYTATPAGKTAKLNTATATFNTINFIATAPVNFVANVINGTATVTDTEIDLDELLTAGQGPWEFDQDYSHTCSTTRADYFVDGVYKQMSWTILNWAYVKSGDIVLDSEDATTTYTCDASFVDIIKTTNDVVDSTKDIRFKLYDGAGVYLNDEVSTFGDADGQLQFATALVPGEKYTVCEAPVPAGYTFEITVDGGIVLTYAGPPGAIDPTGEIQCFDFVAAASPTTLVFHVNNSYPGGAPRTPGYWKNWNTCTGGGQDLTAAKLGGVEAGVYILDDLLPQTVGTLSVTTCDVGVKVLSAYGISDKVADKNMSSDVAYTLARAYLAARLNQDAGACVPTGEYNGMTFEQVLTRAQDILEYVNFNGSTGYLGPKVKGEYLTLRNEATVLMGIIDDYNNSELCTGEESH